MGVQRVCIDGKEVGTNGGSVCVCYRICNTLKYVYMLHKELYAHMFKKVWNVCLNVSDG